MKIIFAGTPEFAVPALSALIEAGHTIVMVLTQPDRPAGRGMQLRASPVKQLALQHQLPVFQPESLKPAEVQSKIDEVNADVMIVAAYGLIIPTTVLGMPRLGCYNIHASLLPRWRGAAPIHRALLAGDAETGVTIMEVVPALDAGAMVMKGHVPILPTDTTQSLHDALSLLGAKLMVDAMATLAKEGKLPSTRRMSRSSLMPTNWKNRSLLSTGSNPLRRYPNKSERLIRSQWHLAVLEVRYARFGMQPIDQ